MTVVNTSTSTALMVTYCGIKQNGQSFVPVFNVNSSTSVTDAEFDVWQNQNSPDIYPIDFPIEV